MACDRTGEALREAFREAAPEAVAVLRSILTDPQAKDADRIRCADMILDRSCGRSAAADGGGDAQVIFTGGDRIAD